MPVALCSHLFAAAADVYLCQWHVGPSAVCSGSKHSGAPSVSASNVFYPRVAAAAAAHQEAAHAVLRLPVALRILGIYCCGCTSVILICLSKP